MAQITKISAQVRRKDLVNIFLDGKYSFSVSLEDVFVKNLKVGQTLEESDIQKLKKAKKDKNIFDLVIRYTSLRPHSEKEIKNYLKTKDQTDAQITNILKRLKKLSLINDLDFAKWFTTSRQNSNKGSQLIKYQLLQKGVGKDIITKALLSAQLSDKKLAANALDKKLNTSNLSTKDIDFKAKQKLLRYLITKGFDYETSRSAIDLRLKKV